MDLRAEARARLRDPWLPIVLVMTLALPALVLVASLVARIPPDAMPGESFRLFVRTGLTTVALFPLLALFLAAAAPEAPTRGALVARIAGDALLVGGALLLGCAVAAVAASLVFEGDAAMFPALVLVVLIGTLYFLVWRALGAAADAPGRETGALLRRIFVAYLVVSVLLPRALQETAYRASFSPGFGTAEPPSSWLVLAQLLSPATALQHLESTTFPGSGSFILEGWEQVSWYAPWPFLAALVAWAAVPLALATRRYPTAPPPERPEAMESAQ